MAPVAGDFNYEPDAPSVPDECYCEDCARFREQIVDVRSLADYYYGDGAATSLFDAGACIKEAWVRYQSEHPHFLVRENGFTDWGNLLPRLSTRGSRKNGTGDDEHGHCSDDEENCNGLEHDDDKFMVCDHCMAHGLPCNEASVCNQCRYYGQPCVHRWCQLSRSSKAACGRYSCRYVHEDSMGTRPDDPLWLVLPGKLPKYLARGRMPRKHYSDSDVLLNPWQYRPDEEQRIAEKMLEEAVKDGVGTLEDLYMPCQCEPELQSDSERIPEQELVTDHDSSLHNTCSETGAGRQGLSTLATFGSDESDRNDTSANYDNCESADIEDSCPSCNMGRSRIFGSAAIYPCEHWECRTCAINARKQGRRMCPICKQHAQWIFIARLNNRSYLQWAEADLTCVDYELGTKFEDFADWTRTRYLT